MAPSEVVFVLVPAWHSPEAHEPTTTLLEQASYKVHGINLPTVGAKPALQSFYEDVRDTYNTITQIMMSGRDVVVVSHGYGGVVKSQALASYMHMLEAGYTRTPGARMVRRLVYMSSWLLLEGSTLMDEFGGRSLPWFDLEVYCVPSNAISIHGTSRISLQNDEDGEVGVDDPSDIFYNDCTPEQQQKYVLMLKHHSFPSFESRVTVTPWRVIPSTYIICENDEALPPAVQRRLISDAREVEPSSFDVVERCDAGHCPFISQPEWLVEKLIAAAGDSAPIRNTKRPKRSRVPRSRARASERRRIGAIEKQVIVSGIATLPDAISAQVLRLIQDEEPNIIERDDTVELEIDDLPTATLRKIYDLIEIHTPKVERDLRQQFQERGYAPYYIQAGAQ